MDSERKLSNKELAGTNTCIGLFRKFEHREDRFYILTAAIMMMEAASTSVTSVNIYQTKWCNTPGDIFIMKIF
jgi:hypothetical protein